MKTAKDLTREDLELIVTTAQRAFWLEGNRWSADTEWSWERVEDIASVMVDLGLWPATGREVE